MIHNPMVSGGSSGGAWKEVTREEVAELVLLSPYNILVAIFTPDFPNQPMIVPASSIFAIGDGLLAGLPSACVYGAGAEVEGVIRLIYAYTVTPYIGFCDDPQGETMFFTLYLDDETGASDVIPEGWEIKYFVYEG